MVSEYAGLDWDTESGKVDDAFLAELPEPLFQYLVEELADGWWWRGGWSKTRQGAAVSLGGIVGLQFAMLACDSERVAKLLRTEEK